MPLMKLGLLAVNLIFSQTCFARAKTATTSSYPLYALENEPLPQVGEYNIILDGNDEGDLHHQNDQSLSHII